MNLLTRVAGLIREEPYKEIYRPTRVAGLKNLVFQHALLHTYNSRCIWPVFR